MQHVFDHIIKHISPGLYNLTELEDRRMKNLAKTIEGLYEPENCCEVNESLNDPEPEIPYTDYTMSQLTYRLQEFEKELSVAQMNVSQVKQEISRRA